MKPKLFVLAMATLIVTSCQQSSWEKFSSSEGSFVVSMPAEPTKQKQRVNTQAGAMDMHLFMVEQANRIYLVGYGDYPQGLVQQSGQNAILTNVRNGIIASKPGSKLLEEQVTSIEGYPGRELNLEAPGGDLTMRARFFMVENRVYRLIAITPPEGSSSSDVIKFLDSFQLL